MGCLAAIIEGALYYFSLQAAVGMLLIEDDQIIQEAEKSCGTNS